MTETQTLPGIGIDPKLLRIFGQNPVLTEGQLVTGKNPMTRQQARQLAQKPTLSNDDFQQRCLIRTNDGPSFFKISQPNSLFKKNRTINQQTLKQILSNSRLASQYYSWRDAFAKVASGHDMNEIEWLGNRDQTDIEENIRRDEEYAVTAYEQKNSLETNEAHVKFVKAAQGFFHKHNGTEEKLLEYLGVKSLTADQKSWLIGALCDHYLFDENLVGAKVLKKHPDYQGFAEKFNILSGIPDNPHEPMFFVRNSDNSLVTREKVTSMFDELISQIDKHISQDVQGFLLANPSNPTQSLTPQKALSTRLSLAENQGKDSFEDMLIAKNYLIEAYKICKLHFPRQTKQLQDVKGLLIDNIWSILQSQASNPQMNPS
jgi:hypothetical protein